MVALLAKAVLYGLLVGIVLAIILALIPGGAAFAWVAPLAGVLVAVYIFFAGDRTV